MKFVNTAIITSRRRQDKLNTNYLGRDHYLNQDSNVRISGCNFSDFPITSKWVRTSLLEKVDRRLCVRTRACACAHVCVCARGWGERDKGIEIKDNMHLFDKCGATTTCEVLHRTLGIQRPRVDTNVFNKRHRRSMKTTTNGERTMFRDGPESSAKCRDEHHCSLLFLMVSPIEAASPREHGHSHKAPD